MIDKKGREHHEGPLANGYVRHWVKCHQCPDEATADVMGYTDLPTGQPYAGHKSFRLLCVDCAVKDTAARLVDQDKRDKRAAKLEKLLDSMPD